MPRSQMRQVIAIVVFTIVVASRHVEAQTFQTVALTDDPVPGAADDAVFWAFGDVRINNHGDVAFGARLKGNNVDTSNDRGIWTQIGGQAQTVARKGAPAPDVGDGVFFASLTGLTFNDAGQTAFQGGIAGPGTDTSNNAGIWSGTAGTVELRARRGDQLPGAEPGVIQTGFSSWYFGLNQAGQIGYRANLFDPATGNTSTYAMCLTNEDTASAVAQVGAQIPRMADGVRFRSLYGPSIGGTDQLAFYGAMEGPGIDSWNDEAIWIGNSDSLVPVIRSAEPAPGLPDGTILASVDPFFTVNDAGQVALNTYLSGPGIDLSNDTAMYVGNSDSLNLVARLGNHAPGTEPGVTFDYLGIPEMGGSGHVAFTGSLAGTLPENRNDTGLWLYGPNGLELVARESQQAPDISEGVFLGDLDYGTYDFGINGAGQVALICSLWGENVDSSNNTALFATDLTGQLKLIAHEGDLFEVAPDDFRTIKTLSFLGSSSENGYAMTFNDFGQIVFTASFTDGSYGAFVAAIPEPATILLFAPAVLLLGGRNRHRCST